MSANTIASIHCLPMRLPFHHWAPPPKFAGRPRTTLDSALVRLETQDGTVAWGESYCVEPRALQAVFESWVVPLTVGRDADDEQLLPSIQRTLHNLGRSGPVVHALAGLDIALWDLRAKRARAPLVTLLGGARRQRVRAYASLLQYGGDSVLIDRICTQALNEGYRELKLHERTAPALAAARRAAGAEIPIMVDTNCAWLPHEAPDALAEMRPLNPYWIEEPLWPPEDDQALLNLKHQCGLPLAVGENASCALALRRMAEQGVVDFVQPSVIKLGLTATLDIARACEGTSVVCAPQVAFFGPGFLASVHLIAALPVEVSLERLYVELAQVPYDDSVPIRLGEVNLPDAPGLGAEPQDKLLAGLDSTTSVKP